MAFHLKVGDLKPDMALQVVDVDGNAINLTAADEVSLKWTDPDGDEHERELTIVTASEGRVLHTWLDGETDLAGVYLGEVIVEWPGPALQSFPPQGYFPWFVHPADGITWRDVVAHASEMSAVPELAQYYTLHYVNNALKVDVWGGASSPHLRLGRIALAAHHGKMALMAGTGEAGPVTRERVDQLEREYASFSPDGSDPSFDITIYGKQFRGLMRSTSARGAYVL